jgi:hypothetical protein
LVVGQQHAVAAIRPALPQSTEIRMSVQHRQRIRIAHKETAGKRNARCASKHQFPKVHVLDPPLKPAEQRRVRAPAAARIIRTESGMLLM